MELLPAWLMKRLLISPGSGLALRHKAASSNPDISVDADYHSVRVQSGILNPSDSLKCHWVNHHPQISTVCSHWIWIALIGKLECCSSSENDLSAEDRDRNRGHLQSTSQHLCGTAFVITFKNRNRIQCDYNNFTCNRGNK